MWPKGSAPLSPHGGCSAQLLLTPADLEGVHMAHGRPPPQPLPRAFPLTGEGQLWAGGLEGRRPPGTEGQGGIQLCGPREVSGAHHADPHRGGSQGRACGPSACWEGRAGNCEVGSGRAGAQEPSTHRLPRPHGQRQCCCNSFPLEGLGKSQHFSPSQSSRLCCEQFGKSRRVCLGFISSELQSRTAGWAV